MPEKIQNLSEKIIHIKSENGEADKKLPVKYLSEIITARVEEILMAVLYEIQESGFADRLMSGIVVTGGCAQTANLGNFIYDLSGYRVRTGYPRHMFSFEGCEGITDASAATSIGLVMAAKEDSTLNCAFAKEGYAPAATFEFPSEESVPEMPETLLEFETVEPEPEPQKPAAPKPSKAAKPKNKVVWKNPFGKISEFCGNLYNTVHQEMENEEV